MFPSQQLGQARCPMCTLPNPKLHLAMDCACSHWEVEEARGDAFQQLDTAMLGWQEDGTPESWAEAWPQLSRAQQLIAVVRADFSLGNHHLWGLVSTTFRAAWEQMASAVNDQVGA